jgi:signal transduction histidine kinase
VRAASGEIVGAVAVARDVTEREEAKRSAAPAVRQ